MARKPPASSNRVRLIGGSHRGRWLSFPDAVGLRPTADRTRETLFNWLQMRIAGARCLDLFAGSGALGFEAASRGAARVLMLEQAPQVMAALRQNRQTLQLEQVELLQTDALNWLQGCRETFDLVFVDPPFAARLLGQLLSLLQARALNPGALVYWEMAATDPTPSWPEGLQSYRDKQAGQVRYGLLSYSGPQPTTDS
ncbi:MAG: 16S rRNA (guanine(966)-N(2))-methyltransferase RsmD [Gammaproteobacteria bacterium]|nr:16S rRNA (guanine(966)-N(2))-methyltransferase RsmD [Gammaproteobacteria bacterium]